MKRMMRWIGCIALLSMLTSGAFAHKSTTKKVQDSTTMTQKERRSYERRAWKALGGTYFFFGGTSGQVVFEAGIPDAPEQKLFIDGQEYPVTVDKKTGRIVARDEKGKIVFDGYCTNGGNSLEGRYKGKKIKVDGSGD